LESGLFSQLGGDFLPKYTDAQKQQWAEQRQQQLTAITDMLEQCVADVFTS
jgi:hypothetical protein